MVSSKRLQHIQPKIKEIQDKHKNNPQLAGTELMALYKKEGVSPL
jgi:YidC/Oxa1 family membrane protein insertase